MNDLIQRLESYNFVDELGHPLVNCVEWEELKIKAKAHEIAIEIMIKCFYTLSNPFSETSKQSWAEKVEEMQKKKLKD